MVKIKDRSCPRVEVVFVRGWGVGWGSEEEEIINEHLSFLTPNKSASSPSVCSSLQSAGSSIV